MRIVVLGAGGIGGTIGARLHQGGYDVALVARGAHGAAIRRARPHLRDPAGAGDAPHPRVRRPVRGRLDSRTTSWSWRRRARTRGRRARTRRGRRAGTPVVAAQNGVANERTLARWFDRVHGLCVMMPTEHLEPGRGRRALGRGDRDPRPRRLPGRRRRRRRGARRRAPRLPLRVRRAARHHAAGSTASSSTTSATPSRRSAARGWTRRGPHGARPAHRRGGAGLRGRRDRAGQRGRGRRPPRRPPPAEPVGGRDPRRRSTWQSLARGSGVETDYLNGEIALLGRLHGVPTRRTPGSRR